MDGGIVDECSKEAQKTGSSWYEAGLERKEDTLLFVRGLMGITNQDSGLG